MGSGTQGRLPAAQEDTRQFSSASLDDIVNQAVIWRKQNANPQFEEILSKLYEIIEAKSQLQEIDLKKVRAATEETKGYYEALKNSLEQDIMSVRTALPQNMVRGIGSIRIGAKQIADGINLMNKQCPQDNPLRFDGKKIRFQSADLKETFEGEVSSYDRSRAGRGQMAYVNEKWIEIRFYTISGYWSDFKFDIETGEFINGTVSAENVSGDESGGVATGIGKVLGLANPRPKFASWTCSAKKPAQK